MNEQPTGVATPTNTQPESLGEPKIILTDKEAKRFWSKVDKTSSERGCWLWKARLDEKGYGRARLRGKVMGVHRISFMVHSGSETRGLLVCHSCDVRNCINPAHLWLGTNEDNIADMIKKGRAGNKGTTPRGEKCYASKVTEAQVIEMHGLYQRGEMSQKAIAVKFGLQQMQVSRIMRGDRWKHLKLVPLERNDYQLNEQMVIQIREMYGRGTFSQKRLSEIFGVSQTAISRVTTAKSWVSEAKAINGIRFRGRVDKNKSCTPSEVQLGD